MYLPIRISRLFLDDRYQEFLSGSREKKTLVSPVEIFTFNQEVIHIIKQNYLLETVRYLLKNASLKNNWKKMFEDRFF